jgi:hypothetical protein
MLYEASIDKAMQRSFILWKKNKNKNKILDQCSTLKINSCVQCGLNLGFCKNQPHLSPCKIGDPTWLPTLFLLRYFINTYIR